MDIQSPQLTGCPKFRWIIELIQTQFAKDEMNTGMKNLTKKQTDTCTFDPVSQKPYPIAMKHYDWVKDEIHKL